MHDAPFIVHLQLTFNAIQFKKHTKQTKQNKQKTIKKNKGWLGEVTPLGLERVGDNVKVAPSVTPFVRDARR